MLLCLGDIKLLCFVEYMPYSVQVGMIYLVELSLCYLNGCELHLLEKNDFSISRLTTGFSHKIGGYLAGDRLISQDVIFQDDYFAKEYAWLDGHFVETTADRISLAFC